MTNVNNYSGNFQIDAAHSEIGFVARHAMVTKVRGAFTDFEGTATTGENLEGAKIEVKIDVNSVDTRNADRDAHLTTGDFFDTEKYPHITFTSTDITAAGESTLRAVSYTHLRQPTSDLV